MKHFVGHGKNDRWPDFVTKEISNFKSLRLPSSYMSHFKKCDMFLTFSNNRNASSIRAHLILQSKHFFHDLY